MEQLAPHEDPPPPFWRSRFGLGWLVLAAVAAWFLWAEHRVHMLGALPWLIILACPLMHVFMHRGRHGQKGHGPSAGRSSANEPPTPGTPGAPR